MSIEAPFLSERMDKIERKQFFQESEIAVLKEMLDKRNEQLRALSVLLKATLEAVIV